MDRVWVSHLNKRQPTFELVAEAAVLHLLRIRISDLVTHCFTQGDEWVERNQSSEAPTLDDRAVHGTWDVCTSTLCRHLG